MVSDPFFLQIRIRAKIFMRNRILGVSGGGGGGGESVRNAELNMTEAFRKVLCILKNVKYWFKRYVIMEIAIPFI